MPLFSVLLLEEHQRLRSSCWRSVLQWWSLWGFYSLLPNPSTVQKESSRFVFGFHTRDPLKSSKSSRRPRDAKQLLFFGFVESLCWRFQCLFMIILYFFMAILPLLMAGLFYLLCFEVVLCSIVFFSGCSCILIFGNSPSSLWLRGLSLCALCSFFISLLSCSSLWLFFVSSTVFVVVWLLITC